MSVYVYVYIYIYIYICLNCILYKSIKQLLTCDNVTHVSCLVEHLTTASTKNEYMLYTSYWHASNTVVRLCLTTASINHEYNTTFHDNITRTITLNVTLRITRSMSVLTTVREIRKQNINYI